MDLFYFVQGSASEVMVLRTARRYDIQTQCVILGNGMPMTKDSMKLVGLNDYVDSLFQFCHRMAEMGVDNAEYALITAMCLLTGEYLWLLLVGFSLIMVIAPLMSLYVF